MTHYSHHTAEKGVTALFLVLFASLLLSIITVSFAGMMIREQQRSTDDEQSQSAYDAALAGVEDAKRVIAACSAGNMAACTAIESGDCDTVSQAGIETAVDGEVLLQTTEAPDGSLLNQAYTCVTIDTRSPTYPAEVARDESVIIPLKADGAYSRIIISWHTMADGGGLIQLPSPQEGLPVLTDWTAGRPALLRTQLMLFDDGNIDPDDFDDEEHARTIFLYPQTAINTPDFSMDARRADSSSPESVTCSTSFPLTGYACQAVLSIPSSMSDRDGYLRLTSLYNGTNLQVELKNSANGSVNFRDVQTVVDSTGRANDLFRRVEARIESVKPDFPYPRATIDITNNFCKVFSVSTDVDEYDAGTSRCDPSVAGGN